MKLMAYIDYFIFRGKEIYLAPPTEVVFIYDLFWCAVLFHRYAYNFLVLLLWSNIVNSYLIYLLNSLHGMKVLTMMQN